MKGSAHRLNLLVKVSPEKSIGPKPWKMKTESWRQRSFGGGGGGVNRERFKLHTFIPNSPETE